MLQRNWQNNIDLEKTLKQASINFGKNWIHSIEKVID